MRRITRNPSPPPLLKQPTCEYSEKLVCEGCKGATYLCDPIKNEACGKQMCGYDFMVDGPCFLTTNKKYAKIPLPICLRETNEHDRIGSNQEDLSMAETRQATFGERLHYLRTKRGTPKYKLSQLCGLNDTAISALEADKWSPRADTLIIIANYFNVTTDYLLGIDDFGGNPPKTNQT